MLSSIAISNALANPDTCLFIDKLKGGHIVMMNPITPLCGSGRFAVVYKYILSNGSEKAIRVWFDYKKENQIVASAKEISNELRKLDSIYFLDFEYYENAILVEGDRHPLIIMEWCDGDSLKSYIKKHLFDRTVLDNLSDSFLEMFIFLHKKNISHGDLQHKNICVENDGQIKLLDYDSLYFHTQFFNNKKEVLSGVGSFQHPDRKQNTILGPFRDYFSELVIFLSIIAIKEDPTLWYDFRIECSDDRLLFSASDFNNIRNCPLYERLIKLPEPIPTLLLIMKEYLEKKDIKLLRPFYTYCNINTLWMASKVIYCINCGCEMTTKDYYCINCGIKLS